MKNYHINLLVNVNKTLMKQHIVQHVMINILVDHVK